MFDYLFILNMKPRKLFLCRDVYRNTSGPQLITVRSTLAARRENFPKLNKFSVRYKCWCPLTVAHSDKTNSAWMAANCVSGWHKHLLLRQFFRTTLARHQVWHVQVYWSANFMPYRINVLQCATNFMIMF